MAFYKFNTMKAAPIRVNIVWLNAWAAGWQKRDYKKMDDDETIVNTRI